MIRFARWEAWLDRWSDDLEARHPIAYPLVGFACMCFLVVVGVWVASR